MSNKVKMNYYKDIECIVFKKKRLKLLDIVLVPYEFIKSCVEIHKDMKKIRKLTSIDKNLK